MTTIEALRHACEALKERKHQRITQCCDDPRTVSFSLSNEKAIQADQTAIELIEALLKHET